MSSSSKTIKLMSCDGQTFVMEEAAAIQSQIINHLIEDGYANGIIPLPNVTGETLSLVIKYCNKHAECTTTDDEYDDKMFDENLKTWDAEFVKVDQRIIINLLWAADYLNIKSLLDLACQTVADMITNNSPEQIREIFNIKNDFTVEEEVAILKEIAWAFY